MQSHILPTEDLACIHRFAVLLTGSAASAQVAVLETFEEAGEKIHHFRSGKNCKAWLVAKVRSRLAGKGAAQVGEAAQKNTGLDVSSPEAGLKPEAAALAQRFCKIAEPGRSALALLYLDQFSTQEIAQILQMTVEELSVAVDAARIQLGGGETVQPAQHATFTAPEQGLAP